MSDQTNNPLAELSPLNQNICLSGGAKGADLLWGYWAGKTGHGVIHWSFENHKTYAPESEVVRLTVDQLSQADPALIRTNQTLKRHLSFNKPWLINLLRRNWYQIAWSQSLYAISDLNGDKISGGTAWAVSMYLDRFICDQEPLDNCRAWLFDKNKEVWYAWEGTWYPINGLPPKPEGIWTGIGSREINQACKNTVREIFKQ